MIISDFTTVELKYFEEQCNFVGKEYNVFELRSQGKSLTQVADILEISIDKAKKLSQRVNKKIKRVI